MKRKLASFMAVFLVIAMCLPMPGMNVFAMEANDPAAGINLIVPEELQDGNNYFFIRESGQMISEKSTDKLYIPVQRTGKLEEEAEVTLKLVDVSSRSGENYKAEILDERVKPELVYGGESIIDVIQNATSQEEVETMDENDFGQAVHEAGGAELIDAYGNPVGTATASPLDENGNPVKEESQGESAEADTAETAAASNGEVSMSIADSLSAQADAMTADGAETTVYEPDGSSGTDALRGARDAFTGTVSDRQEMVSSEDFLSQMTSGGLTGADAQEGTEQEEIDLVKDDYPGREFRLHFKAGEEAKFLVITPKYSEKADGNCDLMAMLMNPSDNTPVHQGFYMTNITILDEDTPEPVTVSMAAEQVTAEDGTASITVTREGRINSIVGVKLTSWDGTAEVNTDYGGVDANLYFAMGITERTIELPVGNGVEEKDFHVSISPVTECRIGLASTQVIIPPAEDVEEASLMSDEDIYGDPWNLKERKERWERGSVREFLDDYGFYFKTSDDVIDSMTFCMNTERSYAYDGVHIEYDIRTNYADAEFYVQELHMESQAGSSVVIYDKKWGDCGDKKNLSADAYFNNESGTEQVFISIGNTGNHQSLIRNCRVHMWVHAVKPIKRKFNITVDNPESLDFLGMDPVPEGAVNPYERFMVNNSLNTSFSVMTGGKFSVSAIKNADTPQYTRLTGIEAVSGENTMLVASVGSDSDTGNVVLDEAMINKLGEGGFINWKKDENNSYEGSIHFRPVFKHINSTVEVLDNQYGSFKAPDLKTGTHTFHLGDKLTMETSMSVTGRLAGLSPSGFAWTAKSGKNGTVTEPYTERDYVNGSWELQLTQPYYELEPTFTEKDNQVVVKVSEDELEYFDQTTGLFATDNKWKDGSAWYFKAAADVLANQVVEMKAVPKDGTVVPVWTTTRDNLKYSGQTFYIRTGTRASENVVTLRADRAASGHAYYSVSGSVYAVSKNLSTGQSIPAEENEDSMDVSETLSEAEGAMVNSGGSGTYTDASGNFTLPPLFLTGGTTLRYAVTYNGTVNLREVKLPSAGVKKQSVIYDDPANPGTQSNVDAVCVASNFVEVDAYSADNIHFGNVYAVQEGQVSGVINTATMNGRKTVFTVNIEKGQPYLYDGETCTEHVTDVAMFFKSQFNGDVHGRYFASEEDSKLKWNEAAGTATLTFDKFAPDSPEEFDAGDVLYVQLYTDKKVDGNTLFLDRENGMIYNPVSTGITVTADLNYEPETMEYEMPLDAESLMGGMMDDSRATYGTFPFMGDITFAVQMLSPMKSYQSDSSVNHIFADLADDESGYADNADPDYNPSGYKRSQWNFNVAVKIKETAYGGTRFMLAIVADIGGGGKGYKSKTNPYDTKDRFDSVMKAPLNVLENWDKNTGTSMNQIKGQRLEESLKRAHAGGGYYAFQFFFGLYMDWGYIEITDSNGGTEKSHDMVCMGAGGFFGANATVGVTAYFWAVVVPAYFNFEGTADLTAFIGYGADPVKTLDLYKNEKHHNFGVDWDWQVDVILSAQASITIGAGLYKVAGIRATGGVGAEVDYSPQIPDWYPNIDSPFGYGTNIFFSGTIDLVFVSIPLWSYSWDGPFGDGFVKYFRQVRMGNTLITLVNNGIADGDGSSAAREECRKKVQNLQTHIDAMDCTPDELKSLVSDLRNYARKQNVITYAEYDRSRMNSVGGIFGAVGDAIMMEDGETQGLPMSGDTSSAYFVRDHVDSDWVAGSGELMSGYGPVSSQTLMEDAYAQPNSQILSIGNGRMMMVFLDDRGSGDKTQAAVLKYSIYDKGKDAWSKPEIVQDDATGDSKPNLIDAGDKLILSWSSTTDEKYAALKDAAASELTVKNGAAPSDSEIEEALEADAARVMSQMDIFTVEFDKDSGTFGEIVQLTDDDIYDDYPQAVYDEKTGDYIVLYAKTAQDTEEDYAGEEEQALLDLVNPYADPKKTYSVLAYMLYNNQTDAQDITGNVHKAGWAVDYLFPNETSQDPDSQENYLNQWKGQRFLSSPIKTEEDGKVIESDPPISDLTVCEGYNGLAAFAYTADTDLDLDTSEDKALYLQFYNFMDHRTYVPVRVAGETDRTQIVTPEDKYESGYSRVTTKEAVSVGMPKMVRNGGSTWLFWRQGSSDLKYLNVSELLNDTVGGEDDQPGEYAVRADGTFAIDPVTGRPYEPEVQSVDIASGVTEDGLNITEYQVLTDAGENLYVVYTDTTNYEREDPVLGSKVAGTSLEVYVTAMIQNDVLSKEQQASSSDSPEDAYTGSGSWSRPNRLTRDNTFNDGIAIALDEDGQLIIVHNQYSIEDKRGDLDYLEAHGLITTDENGEEQLTGDPFVRSPISMVVTRCAEEGTVEVVDFDVSDTTPNAGDVVQVSALLANNGLTAADGYLVDFYEYKDGKRGKKIDTQKSDERMYVNTGRWVNFEWTVPSEGIEGYSIQAAAKEKKKGLAIGYYEENVVESGSFSQVPEFNIVFDYMKQNGDVFDVRYTVANTGNKAAEKGTEAELKLKALHGDLKEVYGLDDSLLLKTDLSGLKPGESRTVSESLTIPVSVFKLCGYDAVAVEIEDGNHQVLEFTGARTIIMDEPMNLKLNNGENLTLSADETKAVSLDYDTTVFLESPKVVYSVEDNSIADVDEQGNVTARGTGTTTLTATLLPSGRSTDIKVKVQDGTVCPRDGSCPMTPFTDADKQAWYHDGVHWAIEKGVMNGTGDHTFEPLNSASRAMIVTMLWRMEGSPEADGSITFKDVADGQWYTDAVRWAASNGIVNGYDEETFGTGDSVTREQLATILYRSAKAKGRGFTGIWFFPLAFKDADQVSDYAYEAMCWMNMNGIINGVSDTELSPKSDAVRAQVATMLMRFEKSI